ncbi:MAG: Fur family transcriptional regulator [Planctomycetota bacterium]
MPYRYQKQAHREPGGEVEIFEAYLRERGLKLTSARRQLLDLIFENHAHFTADDLFDQCRAQQIRVSKATLYRTLSILLDCKLLAEHDFGQGAKYYEHIYGHRNHYHFFCNVSKKIVEFRSEKIERLLDEVAEELGFLSLGHTLTIFGVSAECRDTPKGRALIADHEAREDDARG